MARCARGSSPAAYGRLYRRSATDQSDGVHVLASRACGVIWRASSILGNCSQFRGNPVRGQCPDVSKSLHITPRFDAYAAADRGLVGESIQIEFRDWPRAPMSPMKWERFYWQLGLSVGAPHHWVENLPFEGSSLCSMQCGRRPPPLLARKGFEMCGLFPSDVGVSLLIKSARPSLTVCRNLAPPPDALAEPPPPFCRPPNRRCPPSAGQPQLESSTYPRLRQCPETSRRNGRDAWWQVCPGCPL
jgi:hypothetical protein